MPISYANAAGLNPEDVYDPDVVGDGPDAAISGIGYRKADGTFLRFAAIKYGTAAANHGYRLADGRDFSALWAKKGTAVYTTGINGLTFIQGYTVPANATGYAQVTYAIKSTTAWEVFGATPTNAHNVLASGPIPSGAATCRATFGAISVPVGETSAGAGTSTSMSTAMTLGSRPYARLSSNTFGASAGSRQSQVPLTIEFFNSSGALINSSTCTLLVDVEGSV